MRKINKKNNFNINFFLMTIIFIVYVLIGSVIFTVKNRNKEYREDFLDVEFKDMTGYVIKSIYPDEKKEIINNKQNNETEEEQEHDFSYIIEQERIRDISLDNYNIKGPDGKKRFYLDGIWNLNEVNFRVISTAGGMLEVQTAGPNRYTFKIEDLEIDFYYKNSKILGKISINDNSQNFYIKKYKNIINFFNESNTRVAYGKYFKTESTKKNDNLIHSYKLVYNSNFYRYRQIFLIIYIVILQIAKGSNFKNTNMLV